MSLPRTLHPLVLALGLTLVATPGLAQPDHAGGQHAGQGASKSQGHQGGQERRPAEQGRSHDDRGADRRELADRRHDDPGRDHDRDHDNHGFDIDIDIDDDELRDIFHRHRDWIAYDDRDRLPPGIRQNLARGKPLPPGVAKNFEPRVLDLLPHYDGYEWRRVGLDAVLVDVTNDLIHEVIHDIL